MILLLSLIFTLTLADILLTYYGLHLGVIYEGNPLMIPFVTSPALSVGLMLAIALGLIFVHSVREQVRWLFPCLILVLAVKGLIMLLHLSWLTLEWL